VTDVLKHGYGYRYELNRLFLALARSAGFDAQPMKGAQRDETFTRNLPSANALEEFVAIGRGEGRRYFDPGTAFLPFGMLAWDNAAVPGVVMAKKQPAEWINIPPLKSSDAMLQRVADLRLEGESLVGTIRLIAHGHEAVSRRWDVRHSDEAEKKKTLEDEAKAWLPEGSTVKLSKTTGGLVAEFDVTIVGLGSSAGSRFVLPLSVFTSTRKNPFTAETRTKMIYFKHAYETSDSVKVTLPDDMAVDVLPQPTEIAFGDFDYKNSWKAEKGALTFSRSMAIKSALYKPESYPAIRTFFSRVNAADQETVILKSLPAAKAGE
jgi:hypothetical protein